MRAVLRGKIYKPTHEKGGFSDEIAPLIGTDVFGNRYYEDFTHLEAKAQTKAIEAYITKDRFAGFDLSKPCAMRLHLIKLAKDRYHFIWTNHHILLDGWCNPILLTELVARYGALTKGKKPVIYSI